MNDESVNPEANAENKIYATARDLNQVERPAFLAKACGGDVQLRERIEERLRRADEVPKHFLPGDLDSGLGVVTTSDGLSEKPSDKIGGYKLLKIVGEGGFGVVYEAEQQEPVRRKVALKIIKLGMDTKQVVARFEAERQALALMDHPSIAKVFDAGATENGRPFFVMELVAGIPITEHCNRHKLPIRDRIKLFVQVCAAIQHAHQKGIIHRDIKPSNILVTFRDGAPVPKVIDFGIAKALHQRLTDKTVVTQLEQFLGTPAYMSPEQTVMDGQDIDTRSDIYSLGVLLYELLTGNTPFETKELLASGLDAMRRVICETEPPRPSTRLATTLHADLADIAKHRQIEAPRLVHLIRGDLDWIVMKTLEKDRTRRYETANGLAVDIQRHLRNEPVTARPPSNIYRFQKMIRRNKLAFAAGGTVAAVLVLGFAVSTWQAVRAIKAEKNEKTARQFAERSSTEEARQRKLAEENARKATVNEQNAHRLLYTTDMRLAQQAWEDGSLSRLESLLQAHQPQPGETDLRGFEYFRLQGLLKGEQEQVLYSHTNAAVGITISPDGKWLASRGETEVRLWNLTSLSQVAALSFPGMKINKPSLNALVRFNPSFSYDSQHLAIGTTNGLELFHIPTRQTRTLSTIPVEAAIFSPVTNLIAFNPKTNWAVAYVWDYATKKEVNPSGMEGDGWLLCWSPDGTLLVTGGGTEHLDLFDRAAFNHRRSGSLNSWIFAAVFSPDGRLLAAADWQGKTHLLETTGLKEVGTLASGDVRASALAFSPDGKLLATGSGNEAIQIWDVKGRRLIRQLRGNRGRITGLAFTPDCRTLASTGLDGKVMLWNPLHQGDEAEIPNGIHAFGFAPPQFSPDGKLLGLLMEDGAKYTVLYSDSLQEAASIKTTNYLEQMVSFSPDFKQRVTLISGQSPELQIWTIGASSNRATIYLDAAGNYPCSSRLSPDGTAVATVLASSNSVWERKLFNAATGELFLSLGGYSNTLEQSCFLPDGRTFACSDGMQIQLWDLPSRKKTRSLECNLPVWIFSVSPQGKTLAAAGLKDNSISLWDLKSGARVGTLSGHQASVQALAFSPDGRTLASGSEDRTLKLWNLPTQQELASFTQNTAVYWLAFSPDNQLLVSGGIGSYHFWRAPQGGDAAVMPWPATVSLADLPTNSIWRVPDGPHPLPPRRASAADAASKIPPSIVAQPVSQTAIEGGAVSISVSAAGGPPLSYQWRNGPNNLTGETNDTLTFTNVMAANAGNYSVVVTNHVGSAASSNAALTILQVREETITEVNFQDKQPSKGYAAYTFADSPVPVRTNVAEVAGAGIDGTTGLVMTTDRSGFTKNTNLNWAGFGVSVGASAGSANGITTTNLNFYKLYATVKTAGLTGTNSHGRVYLQFNTSGNKLLNMSRPALLTTNYQVYPFVLGNGNIETCCGGSFSEFIAKLDQIDSIYCAVSADNWLNEYSPDADNALYICEVKFVRLVPTSTNWPPPVDGTNKTP